jgi:hypothetical protein
MRTRVRPEEPGPSPDREQIDWLASIDSVWVAVAIALPAIVALASAIIVIDLAYHLRAGNFLLGGRWVGDLPNFSFAESERWIDQQWGAQVVFALLQRLGGFATLAFSRGVAIAVIAWFVYLSCRARGADRRAASILTSLATIVALPTLGVRPQLFGLVLFAAALWILTTRSTHPARLWVLPVLAGVWANMHGSVLFLIPMLLITLWESFSRREPVRSRLAVAAVIAVVATFVNPYGPSVWVYIAELTMNPTVQNLVTEWEPLTIRDSFGVLFFASIGAVVLVLIRRSESVTVFDLLWLGAFVVVGLSARRSSPWWSLVAATVVAGLLARRAPASSHGSRVINTGFLLATLSAALLLLPWWRPVELGHAPTGLVAAVREATPPQSRLIVHQSYASWFEYALPDRPVFVDSRIELYERSTWSDYLAIQAGRADWPQIVDRWQADAIVARRSWKLVPFILEDPAWRLVFQDDDGFVFVRT